MISCAIIGTGPAALLAADLLSAQGIIPTIFERRSGPGWKLLVAGSSGLNVTHESNDFASFYTDRQKEMAKCLEKFTPQDWLAHLHGLGMETFLGTSRRYFLKSMKASPLLRAWLKRLDNRGVKIQYKECLVDWIKIPDGFELIFQSGRKEKAATVLFAVGGGSWEDSVSWPNLFSQKNISVSSLTAANAGYHIDVPPSFFANHEGKPIKGVILRTARGEKQGELMITRYGLEGTPVYTMGCPGPATLDLKPDLSAEKLLDRLQAARGTPKQRVQNAAKLSEGALALLSLRPFSDLPSAVHTIKNFPLTLLEPRPLSEAISTRGGLSWDELTDEMELKKVPGIFCAGEMIDWDAPTGGFLLQGCASTAKVAADAILLRLKK